MEKRGELSLLVVGKHNILFVSHARLLPEHDVFAIKQNEVSDVCRQSL